MQQHYGYTCVCVAVVVVKMVIMVVAVDVATNTLVYVSMSLFVSISVQEGGTRVSDHKLLRGYWNLKVAKSGGWQQHFDKYPLEY